jgi:hypothetical protein
MRRASGEPRLRGRLLPLCLLVAFALGLPLALASCGEPGEPAPVEPLLGKRFPSVVGDTLAGTRVRLPEESAGAPLLVVIAPALEAQEDADRFMVSLRTREVEFVETLVLPSLVTRLMQRYHNGELRESEPRDLWARIVPLYKDGAVLAGFLGEVEDETLAIVLVLDGEGVIRFYDDGGYSRETLEAAVGAYEAQRR